MRNVLCGVALVGALLVPGLSQAQVYSVPVAGSAHRGPAHAKVTIVVACQYTGRYCDKIRPTVDQLFATYKGRQDIRLVYKHFPVHGKRTLPSHLGACAAHRQGKFARMHAGLWNTLYPQKQFGVGDVRALAKRLGLNMRRYDRDVRRPCKASVPAEAALMKKLGVRGTPTWYINGVRVVGAVPFGKVAAVVTKELSLANERISKGTRLRDYYDTWVVAIGRKTAPPRKPYARPGSPVATAVYSVPVANSPAIGPADAKVTMVVSVDFSSPFSKRLRATLMQLRKLYPNDLRLVFKSFVVRPNKSTLPALAACAAHEQGKFFDMKPEIWRMKLLGYSEYALEAAARGLGLDMHRFKADMQGVCTQLIARDKSEFSRLGVTGVPASFINGRHVAGARTVATFQKVINAELAKATARIRAGASAQTYYQTFVEAKGKRSP